MPAARTSIDRNAHAQLAGKLRVGERYWLRLLDTNAQRLDPSAGIGISCWPAHAADADTLLVQADMAMYVATSPCSSTTRRWTAAAS